MSKTHCTFFFLALILALGCNKDEIKDLDKSGDTTQTIDWMQDLIAKYPNKEITLKDIALPRAHDAGVYELNNCLGGNTCNTLTQDQNMKGMLESGIRVFDLRPRLFQGEYWTFHRVNCGGLGCEGAKLQSFLAETKEYLAAHNELIIFEITHLCNTSSQDPGLIAMFEQELGASIFTLNAPLVDDLIHTPLEDLIPLYNNEGKVILLFEDMDFSNQDLSRGLFAFDYIPVNGSYANSPDINTVISDQEQKFQNYDPASHSLFKLCYTFTLDFSMAGACISDESSRSIQDITLEGRERMASTLDTWKANGTITPSKIPNIVSVDFCNTEVTKECIRLSEYSLEQ